MGTFDMYACRICLLNEGVIFIFDKQSGISLCDMIHEFCDVEINSEDYLPSFLCNKCVERVENAVKLKSDIKEADKKLKQMIIPNVNEQKLSFESDTEDGIKPEVTIYESEEQVHNFIDDSNDNNIQIEIPEFMSSESVNLADNFVTITKENEELVEKKTVLRKRFKRNKISAKRKFKETEVEEDNDTKNSLENRTCKECGKVFSRPQNLIKHSTVHTGEKPFKCDLCPKQYTQESNLWRHKQFHSGEKPYICEVCSKQFVTNECLKQHMITHLPESAKKFKCEECGKAFHDKRHLKRHNLVHESARPFVCGNCGKTFNTKFYLTKHHETVHLSIKRHVCSVCEKAFSNTGNLIAHFRIHTGEKPYECKYCDSRFNQSTPLVRHTQQHIERGDRMKIVITSEKNQ